VTFMAAHNGRLRPSVLTSYIASVNRRARLLPITADDRFIMSMVVPSGQIIVHPLQGRIISIMYPGAEAAKHAHPSLLSFLARQSLHQ
jgi:hypothetical protein